MIASRLRPLPAMMRLGLTGLLVTLLIGLGASAMHLVWHYEKRDERVGLSRDDIKAAYAGLVAPSAMLGAIQRGHPEDGSLAKDKREVLEKWLRGERVAENFENIDLGVASPAEIVAQNCAVCHSPRASKGDERSRAISLEFWRDVEKVALTRRLEPTPTKIVNMSVHTHATSLAMLGLIVAGLLWLTRWPRALAGALVMLIGLGLAADIGSWYLARRWDVLVNVIIGAGAVFNGAANLAVLLVGLDLWLPNRRQANSPSQERS